MGSNTFRSNQHQEQNICSRTFKIDGFNHTNRNFPQPQYVTSNKRDAYPYASIFYLQSFFENQYGQKSPMRGTAIKIRESVYLTAGHCICDQRGKMATQTRLIRRQGLHNKQVRFIDYVECSVQRKNLDQDQKYDYAFIYLDDQEWNKIQPLKVHLGQIQYTQSLQILSHPNKLSKTISANKMRELQSEIQIKQLYICYGKLQVKVLQPIKQNSVLLNYSSNCQVGSSGGAVMIKKKDQSKVCVGIHTKSNGGIKLNQKLDGQIKAFQKKYKKDKPIKNTYPKRQSRNSTQFQRQNTLYSQNNDSQNQKKGNRKSVDPSVLSLVGKIFLLSQKNPAFMSKIKGQTFDLAYSNLETHQDLHDLIKLDKNSLMNIKILKLNNNSLTDQLLDKILQMGCWHYLKELYLNNNQIEKLNPLKHLLQNQSEQFTNLRILHLHENQLENDCIDFFGEHEWKLEDLSLSFVWGINEQCWKYFLKKKAYRYFQTLKTLKIHYSNDIQNEDLKQKITSIFKQRMNYTCAIQWKQSYYN